MKNPFHTRAPSFDADAINATIQRALASAGLDAKAGAMLQVTETIRRALTAAQSGVTAAGFDDASVIDVASSVVPPGDNQSWRSEPPTSVVREMPQPGCFEQREFRSGAGSLAYKVYIPAGHPDAPRAMMVMLHGCTQSADDFAAGTQMNRLADEHGFLVVYPEQAATTNPSKCWNWFRPQDQLRGAGEPSLIAGIVLAVAHQHGADLRRIFVAGMSAGGAMAVVLGETYPELFAGVGVHSGMPYGSAHDIPSALVAMKGGRRGLSGAKRTGDESLVPPMKTGQALPLIVFHGDRDHTVQQKNGAQIVQQAQEAHNATGEDRMLRVSMQNGIAAGGRHFSRAVYTDAQGQARIENWTLHGAGHAWSGGHASGSFTDGTGPDASAEMVQFFMALKRTDCAR
jgi:poly(hydroxyalkanoate) depolymerase family esterase